MERKLVLVLAICTVLLIGCNETKISGLQSAVTAQGQKTAELEKKLSELETKIWFLELTRNPYERAVFDPAAQEGFQRVDTSVGTFTVVIEDVKPYADGVKVRLSVGNLTSATVSAGVVKVKWGQRRSKEIPYADWEKTLSETEQKITNDLRPATWNRVTLTLPGIPPEKLGYLEVSMDATQLKMAIGR